MKLLLTQNLLSHTAYEAGTLLIPLVKCCPDSHSLQLSPSLDWKNVGKLGTVAGISPPVSLPVVCNSVPLCCSSGLHAADRER